jgi:hypothetical protein
MKTIKQYIVVILILVPVLILVIIRSVSTNHFKPDTKKLAEPSVLKSNLINSNEMGALSGKTLLILFDEEKVTGTGSSFAGEVLNIPTDDILEKSNFQRIRKHNGPVVIFSSDVSLAARMWMILSQMGIDKLYLLTEDKDNESFKNKFRPDSLTRPEL